jgi:chromatin assembly factor 1 subunit A
MLLLLFAQALSQIRLLSDTPFPIDPFTFTSVVRERRPDAVFAVPSLPDRLVTKPNAAASAPSPSMQYPSSLAPAVSALSIRRTVSAPKTTFPDTYLPQLLAKITSLETGNFTFLVESIYQEFRGFGVKKNAVEAKVKEVSEKSKERKVWIVKPDATVSMFSILLHRRAKVNRTGPSIISSSSNDPTEGLRIVIS